MDKHLTDIECAAHYQQAQATLLAVKTIAGGHPLTENDPYLNMAQTWHRFATTPPAKETQ